MSDAAVGAVVALVHAAVFGTTAVLLARSRAPRVLTSTHASVALLLLVAAGSAGPAPGAATVVGAVVGTGLVPALVMLHPDGRPVAGPGPFALLFVGGVAVLCVAYPVLFLSSGLGPFASVLVAMVATWWRYEAADGDPDPDGTRRAVLWIAVGAGGCLLVAGLLQFVLPAPATLPASALVTAPVPLFLVVATLWPDLADVRAVVARVVVDVVALWVVVAVFVGVVSCVELLGGRAGVGVSALAAAAAALTLQPCRLLLRRVVDRLLFGDRDDPVLAASHVSRTLSDDPAVALRALRDSLALPYAALLRGDAVVATAGEPVDAVHRIELVAADRSVGRLDVGLRPGQLRLARADATVLDVVVPALTQALHARALSQELLDSRAAVLSAVEDERRRLRRDLHDGLGPTLTGIAFAADAAGNTAAADPDRARRLIAALRADATDAIVEVRRLVDGLRPPAIDELGLVGALHQQVRSLLAADGRPLEVRLHAPDPPPELPAAIEVATYRIVTEALTNVARHSGGHRASVRIDVAEDRLRLDVRDDGRRDGPWEPGVGLTSMRERAEQLGGTFETSRGADGGRVSAVLPVA